MIKRTDKINIQEIELIIYDFDGVMTDNRVLVDQDGKEAVFCNRADGLAISRIKKMGISQMIVSTETNIVVSVRAEKLRIPVIQGVGDKQDIILRYCEKQNIDLKKVIYIGNDINDLEIMMLIGYPVAPSDASIEIKNIAKIIVNAKGGNGVIRDFLDVLN